MEEDDRYPYVFSLTKLTGRGASSQRRVIVQSFDVAWRSVVIAVAAFLPGLLVAFIFWPFLGEYALGMILVVEVAAFWLVEGRRRDGLHLRNYQAMIDKKRSTDGRFFMCGQPIDPSVGIAGTLKSNTVPVEPPRTSVDPFDIPLAVSRGGIR